MSNTTANNASEERDDLPTAEDWANINFFGATACSLPGSAEDDED